MLCDACGKLSHRELLVRDAWMEMLYITSQVVSLDSLKG